MTLTATPIPFKGTVYVVDDDASVRDSVHWVLEGEGYKVYSFESGEDFLKGYDPDLVACAVVDIRMSGMSGLALQEHLLARNSPVPIGFITGHGEIPQAVLAIKKGAIDFIEKPFHHTDLLNLVDRMQVQAKANFSKHLNATNLKALLATLTSRESQVLKLVAIGKMNKEIADELGLSVKTVETHRSNLMTKFNAHTVTELIKKSTEHTQP